MLLKKKTRPEAEINLGAFSDIAFLLIIFFILTTTLIRPAFEKLSIPSGTSDPTAKEQKNLTINLSPTEIRYGPKGRPVSMDKLHELLKAENFPAKSEQDRIVILDSTDDVLYEDYYGVVMAIAKSGGVLALIEHTK